MNDKHFYLGIDLGTTNSSIHWGALNPMTRLIEPKELSFDQLVHDGRVERRALLPSYIYFKQDEEYPIVGEYARTLGLKAQPSRVAWSVKNYMGRADWRFEVDGKAYTAAQLSGILLQTLFAGIRATWGYPVDDVLITVPASFNTDMRNDTIEAARLAGFKTVNADGSPRNFLLDEPLAALYDLLNLHRAGHIPPALIDFSSPKTVLVFDLGGGTLDVSIHRVSQSSSAPELDVENLAISRYTQLGGRLFDQCIADELQRRFEERHKLKLEDLPALDRQAARFQLELLAEQAKQRLTMDIQRRFNEGIEEIPDNFAVDIQQPFLYDNKGLFTQLTKGEFERLIAPLLGWSYTRNDVDSLDQVDFSRANNIIYPILDVLRKAKDRLGQASTVDTVVLTGGMTRVHAIRERLRQFFGIQPLTILDPEKSVSRGAAIYHYQLHRGVKPRPILAESIGVKVHGERIFHLIPAGTMLPVTRRFDNLFEVPYDNATVIRVPLYSGERQTPEPPNKQLLERRLVLNKPITAGTQIDVEVSIDENKVVHFVANLHDDPSQRLSLSVDSEGVEIPSDVQPAVDPKNRAIQEQLGPSVDTIYFRNEFRSAAVRGQIDRLKQLQQLVMAARNGEELVDVLLSEIGMLPRLGKERALMTLGEYARMRPGTPQMARILQTCLKHVTPKNASNRAIVTTVVRQAVIALGKTGSASAESHLVRLLVSSGVDPIRSDILYSIGKCGASANAVAYVKRYIDATRKADRIAALWAMGKLGSREKNPVIPIKRFLEIIPDIGRRTDPRIEPHPVAQKMAVYALGEICDRRPTNRHSEIIDAEHAEYALEVIKRAQSQAQRLLLKGISSSPHETQQTLRFAEIAEKLVRGEALSEEDAGTLMAVRALLRPGSAA